MNNYISKNNALLLTSAFVKQSEVGEVWGCIAPHVNLYKLFNDSFRFVIPVDYFQQPKNGKILAKWFIKQAALNDMPITGFIRNFLDDDSVFEGYNDLQIEMIISENILLWEGMIDESDELDHEEDDLDLLAKRRYASLLEEDTTSFYGAEFGKQALYKLTNTRIATLCSTALLSYINKGKTQEAIALKLIQEATKTPFNESGYISGDIFDMVFSLTNGADGFMDYAKIKDWKTLEIFIDNMPNKALMENIVAALRAPSDFDNSTYMKACIEFIGENPNILKSVAENEGYNADQGLIYSLRKASSLRYDRMGVTDVTDMDVINAIYKTSQASIKGSDALDRQAKIEREVYSTIAAMVVKEVSGRV